MILVALVFLGQLADGLSLQLALAHGHGTEVNPGAAVVIGAFGPLAMLAVKVAIGGVLVVGAVALRHRPALLSWMAVIGFVGALSELAAVAA